VTTEDTDAAPIELPRPVVEWLSKNAAVVGAGGIAAKVTTLRALRVHAALIAGAPGFGGALVRPVLGAAGRSAQKRDYGLCGDDHR
jgi:hypothetical protein